MKRGLLAGLLVAGLIAGLAVFTQRSAEPPCILLITVDTLRADHLGCYGYERDTSPHLDRLAESSVLFTNASAQGCQSGPQHATLLSSLHQRSHGGVFNTRPIPSDVLTLPEILTKNGYTTAAFVSHPLVGHMSNLAQGFAQFHEFYVADEANDPAAIWRARSWLVQHGEERFFVWVHAQFPHSSYAPPREFSEPFLQRPLRGSAVSLCERVRRQLREGVTPSEHDAAAYVALYDGEIRYTDQLLDGIFESLEESGRIDDCLVIVTSDHGEVLTEAAAQRLYGHGDTLHESVLDVPLIMRFPDRRFAGRRIDFLVESLDVAPTVLDVANLPIPEHFQGRSLLPLASGESSDAAPYSVAYTRHSDFSLTSLVRGDWKLLEATGEADSALYDLAADPTEQRNLISERPEIFRELSDELAAWRARTPSHESVSSPEVDEGVIELLRRGGYLKEGELPPDTSGAREPTPNRLPPDRSP